MLFSKIKYLFILYRLSVRVVSSEKAGSGKSLVVRRLSESLLEIANNSIVTGYLRDMEADVPMCISVPIYGPTVDQCAVVESLLPHLIVPDLPLSRIFHLDVHPSVIIVLLNRRNFLRSLNIFHVLTLNKQCVCSRAQKKARPVVRDK